MANIDYLLILPIIVLVFSAYEIGAITTKRWHTISYYASRHKWLGYLIIGLFLAGGISGGVWFRHHVSTYIPQ